MFRALCYNLTRNLFYIEDERFFRLRREKLKKELQGKRIEHSDKLVIQHFDGMPYQLLDHINFGDDFPDFDFRNRRVDEFARTVHSQLDISTGDVLSVLRNAASEQGLANRFRQEIAILDRDFMPLYFQTRLDSPDAALVPESGDDASSAQDIMKYASDTSQLSQLDEISLVNLANLVSRCSVEDEYLSTVLAIEVLRRKDQLTLRSLANVANAFARPSRVFQSFIGFYEELKEPITRHVVQAMLAGRQPRPSALDAVVSLEDLCGVLTGYSKTYNLSFNFLKLLVKSALEKFERVDELGSASRRGGVSGKSVSTVLHVCVLNRKLFTVLDEDGLQIADPDFARTVDKVQQLLRTSHSSLKPFETCLILKNLSLIGRCSEKEFQILQWNIRTNRRNFNITDVIDSLDIFLNHINANKQKYTRPRIKLKEGHFYQRQPNLYDYLKHHLGWLHVRPEDAVDEDTAQIRDSDISEDSDPLDKVFDVGNFQMIDEESAAVDDEEEEPQIAPASEMGPEKQEDEEDVLVETFVLTRYEMETFDMLIEMLNLLHENLDKSHVRSVLFNINYFLGTKGG